MRTHLLFVVFPPAVLEGSISLKTWVLWEKKGELTYAHSKRVELICNTFSHFLIKQLLIAIFVFCAEISIEQTWNGVVEVGKQG